MITSINEFRKIFESTETDEQKIARLIELCKTNIATVNKSKELKTLKDTKSSEVKKMLENLNNTSVIAKGVLVEIIKPFKSKRLSTTAYLKFIEDSVGIIGKDFLDLHNEVIAAATKVQTTVSHLRMTNNTKDKATGTISESLLSDIWDKIKGFFSKLTSLITKTDIHLENIRLKAEKFAMIKEDVSTEDTNAVLSIEELLAIKKAKNNAASKISHQKRRDQNKAITDSLKEAINLVEIANELKQIDELKATQQAEIIQLLSELNGKSIAIDEKILTIVNGSTTEVLDMDEYQDKMANAQNVCQAVATMTTALLNIHTSEFNVSGHIRQHNDTSNSEDGTRNLHYNHDTRQVEGFVSGVKFVWNKIKGFFNSFKDASHDCDEALANI